MPATRRLRDDGPPQALPPELADAQKRQEKLREMLEKLHEADAARKKDGDQDPGPDAQGRHGFHGDAQQGRRLRPELHADRGDGRNARISSWTAT